MDAALPQITIRYELADRCGLQLARSVVWRKKADDTIRFPRPRQKFMRCPRQGQRLLIDLISLHYKSQLVAYGYTYPMGGLNDL